MLKETETEETTSFLSHFYYWWHFNWGERAAHPGYAYGAALIYGECEQKNDHGLS